MFRHARVGEETRRRRCEMGNISLRDRDTVTAAERGREFWRGVLLAGGFTAVPRWTLDPVPGIAEHEAKICNEVVAALRRLAGELAVPLSSVLLTAHAKVLGALALIAADPDAEHARQTLLSAEELHFQLHGLAGPRRKLSDCRAHELFEERARVHPAAIAAEHGNRRWTYRELNAHANQLARALLARGLSREGVVAVVTERNLDWIAAMLAIFKAGGAYLPIEPHFPADCIARTLSRAGCRLVLSYLEVLLAYLAQYPCELPHLRCVSVTGEALKKELTQRWFAAQPGIKLVNAYGLTETSDDTNHEIMDSVPDRERVPLGPPINNVHVYVVDEHLSPAPLGAPGELVFAGVCVGRGYINDPERTRRAFLADPHRESQRLYRSGDYGRWLPEGKLEFLGRRDTQVKISGFRIEIGEIENTLLRLRGVREGAVVVTGGTDQSKHLVAFYAAQRPLDANALRDQVRESLPEYMVPSVFHWQSSLPLTGNGKIDRKALMALARELDTAEQGHDGPSTATEHRLAAAWAEVLGIPKGQIGRRDQFFDLGGTSLSALRLAITLDRAVSFKDLTDHPILADLATLVDDRSVQRLRAGD